MSKQTEVHLTFMPLENGIVLKQTYTGPHFKLLERLGDASQPEDARRELHHKAVKLAETDPDLARALAICFAISDNQEHLVQDVGGYIWALQNPVTEH